MNATAQTSHLLNMLKPQEAPVVHSQGWSVMDGDECAAGKLASFGTEEEAAAHLERIAWFRDPRWEVKRVRVTRSSFSGELMFVEPL